MTRTPAVAGAFYDRDPAALKSAIEQCFTGRFGPGALPRVTEPRVGGILGLVCPHAGYVYSGGAAAQAYAALAQDGLPDTVVILGPNHWGLGEAVAIAAESGWETPFGVVRIDKDTAERIASESRFAEFDDRAHAREHSIEVQLPFLQFVGGDGVSIVPIAIAHLSARDAQMVCEDLGAAIAAAVAGKSACVIASTDFTHHETAASAHRKDAMAMERIIALDGPGLIRTVYDNSISMCGVTGTGAVLQACRALGATGAHRLAYYTSGDVEPGMAEVVGYGALSITRQPGSDVTSSGTCASL